MSFPRFALLGVGALYLATLTVNHNEAEDAMRAIWLVSKSTRDFDLWHQHHLLFGVVNRLIYRAWQAVGYSGDASIPMQVNSTACALVSLAIVFAIGRRIGLDARLATLSGAVIAASYGFWWYAIEADTYLLPMPLMLACVHRIVVLAQDRSFRARHFVILGACFAAATLLHQQQVLLLPFIIVAVVVIGRRRDDVGSTQVVRGLAVLGATSALLVGVPYIGAAVIIWDQTTVAGVFGWAVGYLGEEGGPGLSATAGLKAGVGATRALWGLHYLFAFDAFDAAVTRAFPHHLLVEERFLAAAIPLALRWACLVVTALGFATALLVAGAALFGGQREHAPRSDGDHAFVVIAGSTLGAYALFNTVWEADNLEFWIAPLPLAVLLVVRALARRRGSVAAARLVAALAVTLALPNFFGSVWPQHGPRADFWRVANRYLLANARAGDLVVTEAGHIAEYYLRTFTDADIAVAHKVPPAELTRRVAACRGRVFISSWVFEPIGAVRSQFGAYSRITPGGNRDDLAYRVALDRFRARFVIAHRDAVQTVWRLRAK